MNRSLTGRHTIIAVLIAGAAVAAASVVGADAWHAAGHTGRGIKVAILDGGFEGYESLLGTELPATVPAAKVVR